MLMLHVSSPKLSIKLQVSVPKLMSLVFDMATSSVTKVFIIVGWVFRPFDS